MLKLLQNGYKNDEILFCACFVPVLFLKTGTPKTAVSCGKSALVPVFIKKYYFSIEKIFYIKDKNGQKLAQTGTGYFSLVWTSQKNSFL